MSPKGVNFGVSGIEKLRVKFEKLGLNFDVEMGRALYLEGEHIMGESKAKFVPVKRGALRASGHVLPPQKDSAGPFVVMGYGGPAVKYAVVQHERLDFKHTVGQAKYLERPALKRAAVMDKQIARRLRKRLKTIAAK
jgi:hypothetical protein